MMKVCGVCFDDLEIKKFVETNSTSTETCNFCKNSDVKTIDLEEVLDFFSEFVDIFILDDEIGEPILDVIDRDWKLLNPEIKSDNLLNEILNRTGSIIKHSTDKVAYIEEIVECIDYWEILKDDLKWKRRFLSDVDTVFDLGWDTFFDSVKELPQEKILYRARIHKEEGQNPFSINEMGSPPREFTTNGRANPEGIPYLYLSEEVETTLYETRVTYLDELSIASFRLKQDLDITLVDFTNYTSPFLNMGNIVENAKSRLLQERISDDLSKPIRRYDSQLEYLPTQFICEFIRYITGADGIVFDSSLHKGGVNYVIFSDDKFECIKVEKYHVTSVSINAIKEDEFLSTLIEDI